LRNSALFFDLPLQGTKVISVEELKQLKNAQIAQLLPEKPLLPGFV